MVYSFDRLPSVSPITGKFVIKLILVSLMQLLAAILLTAGGVLTRNIGQDAGVGVRTEHPSSSATAAYSMETMRK